MKAIILLAGVGSRLNPLTDNTHKSLVKIGDQTILARMLQNLKSVGIKDYIFVTGNREEEIKKFVQSEIGEQNISFVHNDIYKTTNTGYSLLLTREAVGNDDFIKLDGDVVFEKKVVELLIASEYSNCLCVNKEIHLDKEEVKVELRNGDQVIQVGKKIKPELADGESIGIEKLSNQAGKMLFDILEEQIVKKKNLMDYYDDSYTTLVQRGVLFHAVDISQLKAVEIDTLHDYDFAQKVFANS